MEIKRLTAANAEAYRIMRLDMLARHPDAFGRSYAEDAERSVASFAETIEAAHVFGAYLSDELSGVLGLRRESGRKSAHKGFVWGVYVRPEHRGRGLLAALLEAAIAEARGLGLRQLTLTVAAHNAKARRAYERAGFTCYGTEPRALLVDGRFVDEDLMWRPLD